MPGIPPQLFLEGLHDDYDGLTLLLKGREVTDKVLKIKFQSHLGYRNVDETNRLKTLSENPILTTQWPLFIAEENEFINWIVEESIGLIDTPHNYKNYIITTPNDIVDIVSNESPLVEWVE